jgi:hypothetical protein
MKYVKDDIELVRSFSPSTSSSSFAAVSPLHEDIGRDIILLNSKLNRAEKELRSINSQLIDSTTEVILEFKPVFDDQRQVLLLLQDRVQKAYSVRNGLDKAKLFRDLELMDLESDEIIEYQLNAVTPFESWNTVAREVNNYVKKLSMTYQLSKLNDRKMEMNVEAGVGEASIGSMFVVWKKEVQKQLTKVFRFVSLQVKHRPWTAMGICLAVAGVVIVAVVFNVVLMDHIHDNTGAPPPSQSSPAPTLVPTAAPSMTGTYTWRTVFSKGSYGPVDLGESQTDSLFNSGHVFRRECKNCAPSHELIYYKRTSRSPFSAYSNMKNCWESFNNQLNVDFKLYSTLEDMNADRNAWISCNYDDCTHGIGFPRDCGPSGLISGQWNSETSLSPNARDVRFSIGLPATPSKPSFAPSFAPGMQFEVLNGTYRVFNQYHTLSFTKPTGRLKFAMDTEIDVLLVAGGGSGGNILVTSYEGSGGGGGGGVGLGKLRVPADIWINLKVGAGGSAKNQPRGGDSVLSYVTQVAPGFVQAYQEIAYGGGPVDDSGGSGGGGCGYTQDHAGGLATKGSGEYLTYYGSNGGLGTHFSHGGGGGGGGGAMTAGSVSRNSNGAAGGNGITWFVTGSQVYYGGGGGGGADYRSRTGGEGGMGGGGRGGSANGEGSPGKSNTGGGGGGAGGQDRSNNLYGGDGGSGIIMIAWLA